MSTNNQNNEHTEHEHTEHAHQEREVDETPDTRDDESVPATEDPEATASTEDQLQAEFDLLNDRHMRLYAEFDNYKRRTAKERVEMMQTAGKDVIYSLLTVMDDFDRALKMMDNASDVAAVKEGVELISQKFRKILQQQGLKEMEAIGHPFNADYHEAITSIASPEDMKGKVVDEIEKGYFLNDKVLRYAKVVVGN